DGRVWAWLPGADRDADGCRGLPSVRRVRLRATALSAVQRLCLFARKLPTGRCAPSRRVLAAESPAQREGTHEQPWQSVRRRNPCGDAAALVPVVPYPRRMDADAAVLRRSVRSRPSRLSHGRTSDDPPPGPAVLGSRGIDARVLDAGPCTSLRAPGGR